MSEHQAIIRRVKHQGFFHLYCMAVVLVGFLLAGEVSGCPTCKAAIATSSGNSQNLVRGFGWSIIFMMSTPFLILGGLGSYFYFLVRQSRRGTGSAAVNLAMSVDGVSTR